MVMLEFDLVKFLLPVRAPGRLQLDLLAVFDVTFEGLIDQQSVTEYSMVADLCHFVFSLFRGEGEKTQNCVFSPRNNDKITRNNEINKALISAAKYFAPLFIVF